MAAEDDPIGWYLTQIARKMFAHHEAAIYGTPHTLVLWGGVPVWEQSNVRARVWPRLAGTEPAECLRSATIDLTYQGVQTGWASPKP